MKTFVYKTLFIFACLFILYHLTVGPKLIELESRLENLKSRKNIESLKDKVRDELKNAVEKENYLSTEDAKLIRDFINKIKKEIQ
tara:strand:- start:65 stop:319 length:255 start_codon:yes stop_codon:yes gene_type:complete